MNNYILIFDLETNGLPITRGFNSYYPPEKTNYYNASRIIEIGYMIFDEKGNKIKSNCFLIKPDKFDIKNSFIHGITQESANTNGIPIQHAFEILTTDLSQITTIVSHNIGFDYNVLLSECYRYKNFELATLLLRVKKECTMALGRKLIGGRKSPKLIELYKHLFDENIVQTHRALDDVEMCQKCFWAMVGL